MSRAAAAAPGPAMRRAAYGALGVFAVSCVPLMVGATADGTLHRLRRYGNALVLHGQIPYHDFYLEYPPGAVPVFAVPSLLSQSHYFLVFKLLMTACAVCAAVVGIAVLDRVGASATTQWRAALVIGLSALALGPLFLNRYDLWPAALVAVSLLALVAGRPRVAFAVLAVATVAKIYPLAVLPVAIVHVWRSRC